MASTHNSHIPKDVLVKIFLPQSMNTLVRLRQVCIWWDEVISSKSFVTTYLAQQRTTSNKYILLDQRASKSTTLVDSESHIYNDIFNKYSSLHNYECYGICEGLLCLSDIKDRLHAHSKVHLWNPIFMKRLPPLEIEFTGRGLTYLCLGYHGDDYKVIKVVHTAHLYRVCIYSLSTDSWEVINFDIYSGTYASSTLLHRRYAKAKFVNGAAYIVQDLCPYAGDCRIVSFDLSCKTMREITCLPRQCESADADFIMEEYRESLALIGSVWIQSGWTGRDRFVMMWVLRVSSDNSFYWDKRLSIRVEKRFDFQPMGFINQDEFVLRSTSAPLTSKSPHQFFLYNVENECVHQIRLPRRNDCSAKKRKAESSWENSRVLKIKKIEGALGACLGFVSLFDPTPDRFKNPSEIDDAENSGEID